ncbi:MAG: glycosyltransferase [Solirubrobacterales bacterium]
MNARDLARRVLGGGDAGPVALAAPPALLEYLREGEVALAATAGAHAGRLRCGGCRAAVSPGLGRTLDDHAPAARPGGARGHTCSVWIDDADGTHAGQPADEVERAFREWFGGLSGDVHAGFAAWRGPTWCWRRAGRTVYRVPRLDGARSRGYLAQDHEPEFYGGTSAERMWHRAHTRSGCRPSRRRRGWRPSCATAMGARPRRSISASITASTRAWAMWTAAPTPSYFYARAATPRRAVPLGILALRELARRGACGCASCCSARRGDRRRLRPRACRRARRRASLARLYSEASVGMVLSMTNPPLVPTEMLACGSVVDLASGSMVATFGEQGPIALAPPDPLALCSALERLLDDDAERARRAAAGIAFARERTWARAAEQLEATLTGWVR